MKVECPKYFHLSSVFFCVFDSAASSSCVNLNKFNGPTIGFQFLCWPCESDA